MVSTSILSGAAAGNILAIQRTQSLIDTTSRRLASGLRVNSATDNPQNFFQARSAGNRASLLTSRLDAIAGGIRTIQETSATLNVISSFLNIGSSAVTQALAKLRTPEDSGGGSSTPTQSINDTILDNSPVAYFRLNDGGATADNLGSLGAALDGTISAGATTGGAALFDEGDSSITFSGATGGISIPGDNAINLTDQSARTVELFFNTSDVTTSQVLYEEGNSAEYLRISILAGFVLFQATDDGGPFGTANLFAAIEADTSYHAAFTYDAATGTFEGFLNGESVGTASLTGDIPARTGNIGIGVNQGTSTAPDADDQTNGFFTGRISDVAIYNSVLSTSDLQARSGFVTGDFGDAGGGSSSDITPERNNFITVLDELTDLSQESAFLANALLTGGNVFIPLNETGNSNLNLSGEDFSFSTFSLSTDSFVDEAGLERLSSELSNQIDRLQDFTQSLENALGILNIREDFTQDITNTLQAAQQDLTLADQNEESAVLLAAQTQQQLAVNALTLGLQSSSNTVFFDALLDVEV